MKKNIKCNYHNYIYQNKEQRNRYLKEKVIKREYNIGLWKCSICGHITWSM